MPETKCIFPFASLRIGWEEVGSLKAVPTVSPIKYISFGADNRAAECVLSLSRGNSSSLSGMERLWKPGREGLDSQVRGTLVPPHKGFLGAY